MIKEIKKDNKYWQSFIDNLKEAKMLKYVDLDSSDYLYIVNVVDNKVVGHITLVKNALEIPLLEKQPIEHNEEKLFEYFVQTFFVSEDFRRKGYGKELQEQAFTLSCKNDAYQMRSWSSYNKNANYQLKIDLGFSIHPGHTFIAKTNQYIPGVYFIKKC